MIEAEVPGARREDIELELHDNELSISGQTQEREHEGRVRHKARRHGQFDHRVTLPGGADADKVRASLDHGVLTVTVPKAQQAQPHRVEIKDG